MEGTASPSSVAIRLDDDLDLGRGGMLVGPDDVPEPRHELDVLVCWRGDAPIAPGARYLLQHTTRTVRVVVAEIAQRLDINTLPLDPSAPALGPNDVGRVRLRLAEPIFPDAYRANRTTGARILIDEGTNATVGAVLVTAEGDDWPR